MGRRIRWLGIIMVLCFGMVLVQLVNIQYRRAPALAASTQNPRNLAANYDNQRGTILAANGAILAESVPSTVGSFKYQRTYPTKNLFSEIVGYDSHIYGLNGVEYQYDSYLSSHAQKATTLGQLLSPPPATTDNVTLTVDPTLQTAAQTALSNVASANKDGAVVVLQPTTGNVLAMYSSPSFDPNPLASPLTSVENLGRLVQNTKDAEGFTPALPLSYTQIFQPGSTSKVVTSAAAYDLKPALASFSAPVQACLKLPDSDKQLCNDDATTNPCGGMMSEMLPASCDPGYAALGLALGGDVLAKQADMFGYNQVPPLDLPNVAASHYPTAEDFTPPNEPGLPGVAYSAIGQQDVAASALQNALIASAIADGGVIMTPHVMAEVRDQSGQLVTSYQPKPWLRATTQSTAAQITALMEAVISGGTATGAISPSLNAAVKTGTAQTDINNQTDDWMIGFAPATDPQVAVAVVVPYQAQSASGAAVAGPIMNCILATALGDTNLEGVPTACPVSATPAAPATQAAVKGASGVATAAATTTRHPRAPHARSKG